MRKAAIYTVGRQLNDGDMYIFSLYDLEPAGILVSCFQSCEGQHKMKVKPKEAVTLTSCLCQIRAYCSSSSKELTTSPSESELEKSALTRSQEDLAALAGSYDIVS